MNESISSLFQSYLEQHIDAGAVDFGPLLEKNPELHEPLMKKINAYQKIAALLCPQGPPTETSNCIGKEIGGCRIISIIGKGGMGVAYLARQEKLSRDVVIKVLHPFAAESADLRDRFLRESRIIGKLKHVRFHDSVPPDFI